jgi:hypothetical protein
LDTPQKKLSFYQNLILVAAADGILEQAESDFLLLIGNKLGLTAEDVMPIADNLNVLNFVIPEEGLQKTLELQTLVQLCCKTDKYTTRNILFAWNMLAGSVIIKIYLMIW